MHPQRTAAAILISVLLIASIAHADDFNKSGRTAFQFLKIGVGARQAALGEATIASVRDINSVFWNPAGIAGIQSREASFSYNRWFADMNYFAGAVGWRMERVGVFALSYASLKYGDIQEALVPVAGGSFDTRTGNMFTGSDLSVGLTFSHDFTDQLSIGVGAKYLEEVLFIYKVNVFAFDVGTNYNVGYNGLRLAMSAQNFGPSVKWLEHSNREEGYDIPLVYRIGISMNLIRGTDAFINLGDSHALDISVEAVHTNDYGDRFHAGAEYWFNELFALRGGYRFNYEEGNMSIGFGIKQKVSNLDVRLDYAYVSYENLDSPHRLTLSLGF